MEGQLVPASIDAYLVMEWADCGDLFGLRGQLGAGEVRALMRQLLEALAYLHSQVAPVRTRVLAGAGSCTPARKVSRAPPGGPVSWGGSGTLCAGPSSVEAYIRVTAASSCGRSAAGGASVRLQ